MHLDEGRKAHVRRSRMKPGESRMVERGDDQQDRVGAGCPRLEQLIFIDDEVLAQERERHCGADGAEMLERPIEKRRFREDGDGCRSAAVILRRDSRRIVFRHQHTS
jgi:hypothetical protein